MDFRKLTDKLITSLANNDVVIVKMDKFKSGSRIERKDQEAVKAKAAISQWEEDLEDTKEAIRDLKCVFSSINVNWEIDPSNTRVVFNGQRFSVVSAKHGGILNNLPTVWILRMRHE